MSKKTQKIITTAVTTAIAVGSITIPAMATQNKNINELYTTAFEATIKTQDLDKVTQKDINEARNAIDVLRDTSVKSAVPTFSSIVDKAQQIFLTKAYNSIVKCQKSLDQKDINQARENIKDLPPEFKNAYSMAIDEAQQKKIDSVYEAIQKAEKSQKQEDIKIAQDLIDNLKTVVENDAVKAWADKNEASFKGKTQKLIIIGAVALNNNSVKLVFNRPVDKNYITTDNFSVTPKGEDYNNLYVGTAKLSEDGTSVTLKVLDNFKNKGEYVVNTSNIKDTKGNELSNKKSIGFNYESAEVKTIGFTTTNIPISANLRDYIVVKDALGRDVTEQYKDKATFTSTNTSIISKDGQVAKKIEDYVAGKPSNTISYDKNHKIINNTVMVDAMIEGKNIKTTGTITVTKSMPTDFEGYKLVKNYSEIKDKTFSEISKEDEVDGLLVDKKAELVLGFKDQFGKEMKLNECTCVVEENYNPEVAIINNNNGKLEVNALSAGTAYAKIKCGAIEKVICINVKGASLPKEISTKVDKLNLALENEAGVSFDYVVNNNYGEKYTGNSEVVYETKNADNKNNEQAVEYTLEDSEGKAITKGFNISIDENNKITIKPESTKENPLKTGVYKLILIKKYDYKGKETKLTKTIDINVVKGGNLNSYKVKVSNVNLDRNSNNREKNTSTIRVYKIDDKGNEIGLASDVSLEILKDGKKTNKLGDVKDKENGVFTLVAGEEGTYTVNVKVGTYTAKQLTINVLDTTLVPTTVVLNTQVVTVSDNTTMGDLLKQLNYSVKDQFGKDFKDKELKGMTYSVANMQGVSIEESNSLKDVIKLAEDKDGNHNFDLAISNFKMANDKTYNLPRAVLIKVVVK